MENVGIFYAHLEDVSIFYAHLENVIDILWSFGNFVVIWYNFPRFGIFCQEKSGNPVQFSGHYLQLKGFRVLLISC
jgi:hypothetical protein